MTWNFMGIAPTIHRSAFIADTAVIIGDVHVGMESGIWFNSVVRGDVNSIRIGCRSNIQDLCMLHVTGSRGGSVSGNPLIIGDDVTVGHCVTLHGCTIEDNAFIGMNAVILDGCVVGRGAMVAAGSLVTPGTVIPPGTLWMGSPAGFRRDLSRDDRERMARTAESYIKLASNYRESARPMPEGDLP